MLSSLSYRRATVGAGLAVLVLLLLVSLIGLTVAFKTQCFSSGCQVVGGLNRSCYEENAQIILELRGRAIIEPTFHREAFKGQVFAECGPVINCSCSPCSWEIKEGEVYRCFEREEGRYQMYPLSAAPDWATAFASSFFLHFLLAAVVSGMYGLTRASH